MKIRYTNEDIRNIESNYLAIVNEQEFAYVIVDPSITGRNASKNALISLEVENIYDFQDTKSLLENINKIKKQIVLILEISELSAFIQLKKAKKLHKSILITKESNKKKLEIAIKLGINEYLQKPITPESLSEKL